MVQSREMYLIRLTNDLSGCTSLRTQPDRLLLQAKHRLGCQYFLCKNLKFICGSQEEGRKFLRIISHLSPYLDILEVGGSRVVWGVVSRGKGEREYEALEQFFLSQSTQGTVNSHPLQHNTLVYLFAFLYSWLQQLIAAATN